MMKIKKNKKAWIKIVEAFIAVLLVLSVALVIISRQKLETNRDEEIARLLKYTLDYSSQNELLRNSVLSNNNTEINNRIQKIIPAWINFSSAICSINEVCTNPAGYIEKTVYSDSTIIVANLTYYSENAKKLQIFFWEK